jgi:hypothetical protein
MAVLETAAVIAAIAGVASATNSYVQGKQEQRRAKNAAEEQQAQQAKQDALALEKRKNLIDAQRMQIGATGRGTRGSSSSGVKATIPTSETLG